MRTTCHPGQAIRRIARAGIHETRAVPSRCPWRLWVPASRARIARLPGMTAERLELHLRRLIELGARLAEVEEGLRVEAEWTGDQRGGELLDAGVVFLHRVVEEAPRGRQLVLDIGDLGLQLHEVLVGLEIRIGLR